MAVRFTPIDDDSNSVPGVRFTPIDDDASQPESFGTEALNAINQIGGTAGRAIGYGLSDIINVPVEAANYANQKVAGLFGVKPENVPTPEPFNPQSLPMPGVSQEAQKTLDPLARGLATGAELVTPAADIAKLATTGGKAFLKNITGFDANDKATDFIKKLIGNQQQVKQDFKGAYGDLGNMAEKKGYNLLPNSTQKPIESPLFKSQIGGMSVNDRTAFLNNMPQKANDLFEQFTTKPSYQTAHDLQSQLGKYGVKLLKNRDTAQLGGQTLGIRNALNQDITNTFGKYGDTDLAQTRQNITNQYAQNENRLLLADRLKSGIQNLPNQGLTANAQKIVNAYSKAGFKKVLGRYEAPMKTPQSEASISDIMNSLSRQQNTKWLLNKLRIPAIAAGAGIGGALGYHAAKEIF